jgi:hypothetical protein
VAVRTPGAWLELLESRLLQRWAEWSIYDSYYEGEHRLSYWLRTIQRTFNGTVVGSLLREMTDNYMPLVVDSASERLRVQGFRIGSDQGADTEVWDRIWMPNDCENQSNMAHTEAIKLGESYWLVEPPRESGGIPRITCEHPSQVIVACAPGDRRNRLAALKRWIDDDEHVYANVYLPNTLHKYRSQRPYRQGQKIEWSTGEVFANPLGEVPIIPLPNNPSMLRGGRSDLSFGATSLQDLIEKTVVDLIIGSEYHGLPQRVLLGVEPPRDSNGRVISDADMAKSRLWYFNQENAKAHEFSQADLEALRKSVDGFIGDLAAQTRIPIYYFRPQAISNISAEALIGLDAGLVSKTDDKKAPIGSGHAEAIRLALKSMDDPRVSETITVSWADTENRSQAQVVDAAVKKSTIGVPFEQLAEDIGYTPQQVDRMLAQKEADSLLMPPTEGATNGRVPA